MAVAARLRRDCGGGGVVCVKEKEKEEEEEEEMGLKEVRTGVEEEEQEEGLFLSVMGVSVRRRGSNL